jgi:cytochrome c oxidase cbb3-type subunit 3
MALTRVISVLSILIIAGAALFFFRTERQDRPAPVPTGELPSEALRSDLQPGGLRSITPRSPYQETAADLSNGQSLYSAFNCVGCHQHGGGSIGPALMDSAWLYGNTPENIYRSIAEGRPNGMPSFASHIPEKQIWQLVVYVRSLGALVSPTIQASRDDHMQKLPPQTLQEPKQ